MKPIRIFLIAVIAIFLVSCETEIDFNGKESRPILVLNSIAESNAVIEVKLTASRFFLSSVDTFEVVTNASISMYVNDSLVETLHNKGLGIYTSTYKPQPGDKVKLVASAAGYTTIQTEAFFPTEISGFAVDSMLIKKDSSLWIEAYYSGVSMNLKYDTLGTMCNETFRFKVQFSDSPGTQNYYRLIVRKEIAQDTLGTEYGYVYYSGFEDVVFGAKKNDMFETSNSDPLNLFSDELIDGKNHTFQFNLTNQYILNRNGSQNPVTPVMAYFHIEIQPISKSYYLYMKTVQAFENSDNFMSEPVQVYTNIENGLGLFGTRTRQIKKFQITMNRIGSFYR